MKLYVENFIEFEIVLHVFYFVRSLAVKNMTYVAREV